MLSHGRLSILSNVRSEYYSATAAESAAVLSTAATVSTVSTTAASTVSTVVESVFSAPLLAALFPQDAFSLLFKSVILNSCFIKTLQRYTLFQYVVLLKPTFFPHFYVVQLNLLIYSMF